MLLTARLPQASAQLSADPHVGGLLYAALKGLRRLLQRLPAAEAERVLLPDLLPGLCTAYCSPIADVRKATVDCLVALWLVRGLGPVHAWLHLALQWSLCASHALLQWLHLQGDC